MLTRTAPPLIPPSLPEEPGPDAAAPGGEAPAEASPATCQVKLLSQPAHVQVWSAGHPIARTPSALSVPCGAELVFKRPRYQVASMRAPEQPGATAQELSVRMVRPSAHLEVTSAPEGAEVRIHGRTVGHTPASLTVSRYESVSVEVRAAHSRTWKKRLYVRKAEVAVRAELSGHPSGAARHGGGRSPRSSDPASPA